MNIIDRIEQSIREYNNSGIGCKCGYIELGKEVKKLLLEENPNMTLQEISKKYLNGIIIK